MPPATLPERQNVSKDEAECVDEPQDGDDHCNESHSLENSSSETPAVSVEKFNRETQSALSIYDMEGRQIFRDMMRCGRNKGGGNCEPDGAHRMKCSIRMEKHVNDMIDRHKSVYEKMIKSLKLDNGTSYQFYRSLESICDELFANDQVSWGRIITLCAFCVEISRYCREKNIDHVALYVVDALWHYNRIRIVKWIAKEPFGWYSVKSIPPVENPRRTLIIKALLVIGIGLATVGSLARYFR